MPKKEEQEGLDRDEALIIFGLSGPFGFGTYALYRAAQYLGPKIRSEELRPMLPHEGPPLPLFAKTKPEVWEGLQRRMRIVQKSK